MPMSSYTTTLQALVAFTNFHPVCSSPICAQQVTAMLGNVKHPITSTDIYCHQIVFVMHLSLCPLQYKTSTLAVIVMQLH